MCFLSGHFLIICFCSFQCHLLFILPVGDKYLSSSYLLLYEIVLIPFCETKNTSSSTQKVLLPYHWVSAIGTDDLMQELCIAGDTLAILRASRDTHFDFCGAKKTQTWDGNMPSIHLLTAILSSVLYQAFFYLIDFFFPPVPVYRTQQFTEYVTSFFATCCVVWSIL